MTPCSTRCTLRDSDALCRAAPVHMGGAVGCPRLRCWGRRAYPDRTGHGKGGIVMTDRSEIPHHEPTPGPGEDRKSTRLNSSHVSISYAVFCLKKKTVRSLTEQRDQD